MVGVGLRGLRVFGAALGDMIIPKLSLSTVASQLGLTLGCVQSGSFHNFGHDDCLKQCAKNSESPFSVMKCHQPKVEMQDEANH